MAEGVAQHCTAQRMVCRGSEDSKQAMPDSDIAGAGTVHGCLSHGIHVHGSNVRMQATL